MFDMNKLEVGQKVLLRCGNVAKYLGLEGCGEYPYCIDDPDEKLLTISETGEFSIGEETDFDVVGVA